MSTSVDKNAIDPSAPIIEAITQETFCAIVILPNSKLIDQRD